MEQARDASTCTALQAASKCRQLHSATAGGPTTVSQACGSRHASPSPFAPSSTFLYTLHLSFNIKMHVVVVALLHSSFMSAKPDDLEPA